MPRMDGFELCKLIKSKLDYSHIPVILLTAKTNIQSKIEGLELGADAYIEKPFSVGYLHVVFLPVVGCHTCRVVLFYTGCIFLVAGA